VALLLAASVVGCGGHGGSHRVSLVVRAPSALADAPVTIDVRGLPAHAHATLRARWTAFHGPVWSSNVALAANGSGSVALRGVDAARFLWAMSPAGPAFKHPFFVAPLTGADRVALSVDVDGKTVARATLARRLTAPGERIRQLTKRRDGLVGVLFTPRVHTRRPAVLVFGGSEGGNSLIDVAALLAAHGYPALALAYFREPGLPSDLVRIPLEYFARAVRFLRRAPGVDPARVLVMGASRGGEASLLIASTFPRLIHGAIGLVPSDSVYPSPAANLPAWTLHGRAVRPEEIPVLRIDGPVLTVGAGDDHVWGSSESVAQIEEQLTHGDDRFAHDGLVYRDAGHLIGNALPYFPAPTQQSAFGGTARSDAIAKADLWPRILRLLAALGPRR
jgi:dienelactone hydrolase